MTADMRIIIRRAGLVSMIVTLTALLLYNSSVSLRFLCLYSSCGRSLPSQPLSPKSVVRLNEVLKSASMENETVILTTLNGAWANPNSLLEVFLQSFRFGDGTLRFLNHLVIVALDEKAYNRCLIVHKHCFALVTDGVDFVEEAYYMTPNYLKMMWRRIDFLRTVLELGYSFVFTDADIMWFRDPFPHFFPDADFQIACDHYKGSSYDMKNKPNGGFSYVKSNNRSIEFYKFWFASHETYPTKHDQDVLDRIKSHPFIAERVGLKMRFLDTTYFGGLCEPSKDLNKVCTMHVNCCYGMLNKLLDMRIMLQDWRNFLSLPPSYKNQSSFSWRVPRNCRLYQWLIMWAACGCTCGAFLSIAFVVVGKRSSWMAVTITIVEAPILVGTLVSMCYFVFRQHFRVFHTDSQRRINRPSGSKSFSWSYSVNISDDDEYNSSCCKSKS